MWTGPRLVIALVILAMLSLAAYIAVTPRLDQVEAAIHRGDTPNQSQYDREMRETEKVMGG